MPNSVSVKECAIQGRMAVKIAFRTKPDYSAHGFKRTVQDKPGGTHGCVPKEHHSTEE